MAISERKKEIKTPKIAVTVPAPKPGPIYNTRFSN
jgi:hypothetical protein